MINRFPGLKPTASPGAVVTRSGSSLWHLGIPAGPQKHYRFAQLDDYSTVHRRDFPWTPPVTLRLCARASASNIPGTWGFGLWNDPFSLSLGMGGGSRRFPALPNAAWFFFGSAENYLSARTDKPAQGFLAQTFRSPSIPVPVLAIGSPMLSLLIWAKSARVLRAMLRHIIEEDSFALSCDMTFWHTYTLEWKTDCVLFEVDGCAVFKSSISPRGRLGFVTWVDNQYAAFPPNGQLTYGTLKNPEPAWIDLKDIEVTKTT